MSRSTALKSTYTPQAICEWATRNFKAEFSYLPHPDKIKFANPYNSRRLKDRRIYLGTIVRKEKEGYAYAYLDGPGPIGVGFEIWEGENGWSLGNEEVFTIKFEGLFTQIHCDYDDTFLRRLQAICLYYFCAKKFIPPMEMTSSENLEWRKNFRQACSTVAASVQRKKNAENEREAAREEVRRTVQHLEKTPVIELDDDSDEESSTREEKVSTKPQALTSKRPLERDDDIQEIEYPTKYPSVERCTSLQRPPSSASHRLKLTRRSQSYPSLEEIRQEGEIQTEGTNEDIAQMEPDIKAAEPCIIEPQQRMKILNDLEVRNEIEEMKASYEQMRKQVNEASESEISTARRCEALENELSKLKTEAGQVAMLEKEVSELRAFKAGLLAFASQYQN